MTSKLNMKLWLCGALIAAPLGFAQAGESGGYLGASVGTAAVEAFVDDGSIPDVPAFDEDDMAWKIFGGYNFGTGSSREQAATCLQAAGIPLVIAGSFSQTYLRNAFNNGFVCIECPALVERLYEEHAKAIRAGELTLIPGTSLEVDFSNGTVRYGDALYNFPALGSVPQSLVVAGGVENLVKKKLGL